jgi:hypothetical protein
MIPLTLAFLLAAVACLVAAVVLLRSLGRAWQVGRLIAASPRISIAEASQLAHAGKPAFVSVNGRITSAEVFPDEHDRPLVYRRTRLMVRDERAGWRALSDEREAVAFGLEARDEYIAIDEGELDDGLVVIPRVASGRAAELPAELAASVPAEAAAQLVIDQVSAVEHALAAGVPSLAADGSVRLSAGLGRPLILTTLEPAAAMRVLAAGRRRTVAAVIGLLAGAAVLLLAALLSLAGGLVPAALAASPGPVLIDPLDPRAGAGASQLGNALAAAIVVVGAGVAVAGLTYLYVRLGRR